MPASAFRRRASVRVNVEQAPVDLRGWATVSTGPFRFGKASEAAARAADVAPAIAELRAPETLREFIDRVSAGRYVWYDHCVRAAAVLQRVADGELDRVLILWPPRHGKTELVSKLFPAYLLSRRPDRYVALSSYSAALAHKISRAARDNARAGGVALRDDAEAVAEWETTSGGGFWATGVGGPATGKGFHVGIVDDPLKNAEEAMSDAIADRNRDWWSSTWYTRQEPGAALIVAQTRWPGVADLASWLLENEGDEETHPERWHIVAFEAERTDEDFEFPKTCTVEPDPRELGAPLCPERYPTSKLQKLKARIGSFFYRALYQQRKSKRDGKLFKWSSWVELGAAPAIQRRVRYWDLAGTEPKKKGHDPDFTAGVLMGRMADQRTAVEDSVAFRKSIGERDAEIETVAREDVKRVPRPVWWFEKESGVGGTDRTAALVRRVQALGLAVRTEPATGSKLLRAEPLASSAEAGNMCLAPDNASRPWRDPFRSHMADFGPTCDHDDTADAASGAYNKLTDPQPTVGFTSLRI